MSSNESHLVAENVYRIPLTIVNAYMVGPAGAGDRGWVLVDAGMPLSAAAIIAAAAATYGKGARPAAIVLTHGHFDHVGAVKELAERWDVQVYAHPLEMPYLTGRADYPPPDPFAGGGAMSLLSPLYPRHGIDLGGRVRAVPPGGALPHLSGWRWIATPGHAPGHISLFRDADRVLIAGDAFVTTKQESALGALLKPEVLHGPPAYFTMDWRAAAASVRLLANLNPEVAATGHGRPLAGAAMRRDLHNLARNFARLAVPVEGRYTRTPARADENGVYYTPPRIAPPARAVFAGVGAAALAGFLLSKRVWS